MPLGEERRDNLFQARKALPKRAAFGGAAARGERTQVVGPQSDERTAQDDKHRRPRTHVSAERRRTLRREALVEPPRQPHEAARGDKFGKVVECPLPTDILRLILRREFSHIDPVGRDVVRGTAESNRREQRDRNGEERRQVQRQGRQAEQHTAEKLRRDDPEFLRTVELQKRTPKKLDRPRPHDQRRPESNPGIRDAEVLEQHCRDHVQNDERQAHGKVQARDPMQRATRYRLHFIYIYQVDRCK